MKSKNLAPFGSARKRFSGLGFHPGLDPSGAIIQKTYNLSPGQYNVKDPDCTCLYKYEQTFGWKQKVESEEWSRNIGYTHPDILQSRRFLRSLGGPGSYEIPEELFKKQSNSYKADVTFGTKKRFSDPIKKNTPPPGTYTGEWINRPIITHKQITTTPPFEWDGFIDRFRGKGTSWSLPPNIYKIRGSIDALLAKRVSLRGPYDLFTGPRDGSTIKNHFAPSQTEPPEEYFKTWPSELDNLLRHPNYRRCGKFFTTDRFNAKPTQRNILFDLSLCPKDPNDPGPGYYTVLGDSIQAGKPNKYPFNSSVKVAKPGIPWKISPGVGRYKPRMTGCKTRKHQSWVFMSKVGRPEFKAPDYS